MFESKPFRLGQSLSDLQGYEHTIHRGTVDGVVEATMDAFAHFSKKKLSTEADCKWVYRRLMRIRRSEIQGTVFRPTAFAKLVAAAIALSDLRLGGSGLSQ